VQLTGAAIFSLGVWIRCDHQFSLQLILEHSEMLSDHTEAYILITVGGIVMFISFFACIGALLENQCMLAVVNYDHFASCTAKDFWTRKARSQKPTLVVVVVVVVVISCLRAQKSLRLS